MTRIDFYFNVPNKPQLLTDLIASALNRHRQVTVVAENAQQAGKVSAHLWQNKPASFLPNALANEALAAQSPVVVHWHENPLLQDDMLINLTSNEPMCFSRFTQLVELVSEDEEDKIAARTRYKLYRDRGYEIKNIDYAQLKSD